MGSHIQSATRRTRTNDVELKPNHVRDGRRNHLAGRPCDSKSRYEGLAVLSLHVRHLRDLQRLAGHWSGRARKSLDWLAGALHEQGITYEQHILLESGAIYRRTPAAGILVIVKSEVPDQFAHFRKEHRFRCVAKQG